MKYYLSLAVLMLLSWSLSAQNQSQLNGRIFDAQTQEPLIGANVVLQSTKDSTKQFGTSTDLEGGFQLALPQGPYQLKISFLGYETYEKPLLLDKAAIDLDPILLKVSALEEGVVDVVGKTPPAVLKGDTVEFNSKAFKTNPNASAEDLVEKMPGIEIENGTVKAQGETVQQVVIDGKPFFGQDAKTTLKNLPADMVDKVQVYDQKSRQAQFSGFEDGEESKTINIISKPAYRSGTFGRFYAGIGHDDGQEADDDWRYRLGGVYNRFNGNERISILGQLNNINEQNFSSEDLAGVAASGGGGRRRWRGGNLGNFLVDDNGGINETYAGGINYSNEWNKKWKLNGSYFFNQTNNIGFDSTFRSFISEEEAGQYYLQSQNQNSTNVNHRATFRLEYEINERNQIEIEPNLSLQINQGQQMSQSETYNIEQTLNQSQSLFNSELTAYNFRNRMLYRHRLKKKGRTFSVRLQQEFSGQNGNNQLQSENNYYSLNQIDSIDQSSDLDQYERSYSARLEYSEPLSKQMQLQFRYDPSISYNEADQFTYDFDGQDYNLLDTFLSNEADSRYERHRASLGLRYNKKGFRFYVRASAQWAQLSATQVYPQSFENSYNFFNILPFAVMRYKISKTKNLRIFYRAGTDEPSIGQLQEVVDNSNPIQLSIGNAQLGQETNHRIHFHYASPNPSKNTMFFVGFGARYNKDYLGQSTFIAYQDTSFLGVDLAQGTQLTQDVNLDRQYQLDLFADYSFPLNFIKSNFGIKFGGSFSETPSLINNQLNYSRQPSGRLGFKLSSNISEKIDFTLSTDGSLNYSINSLNSSSNNRYYNQNTRLRAYWNPWKSLVLRTDLSHQHYAGLSDGFNTDFLLWNASLSTLLFKSQRGEIGLYVYDILGQNTSLSRNFTASYIEDQIGQVLERYFMLRFSYRFVPKKGSLVDEKKSKEMMEHYQRHRRHHR
ncbi:TonB-dependent receptor [Saprospira grandis]|uniref:TonB-dependent receptor n=1 Tax=Saprospira grandis TaxID=1008 RepID=UPI0022DDD47F|nr:TonB-dependent receptor [Saprospira grandis]WBM74733.1 outer membrane beta-barrel protein [Saprospira grandis]